jgi:hypothetical protein
MKVKVAFYKAKGNWQNRIVRWWTGSPYSHAELVMPDNYTWISISPFLTGEVAKRTKTDFDLDKWDFVSLEIDESQKEIILDFFEETKECKYDWIGMILSQFLPFNIKRKNKWYCSEWIAYALRIAGIVDWKVIKIYNQTDLSPGQLHSIIMEQKKTESD